MTILGTIFSTGSRASALALELYNATTASSSTSDLGRIAKSISNFSLTAKQVGTIIREDDSLPSPEAIECLEDILNQCSTILDEIGNFSTIKLSRGDGAHGEHPANRNRSVLQSDANSIRLTYLEAHLEALEATLSVLLQTLYTAQGIMWAREKPTISPQQAESAITNEKIQLEVLIIEQQASILSASRLYNPLRSDTRLLMEMETSNSLVTIENSGLSPADLYRYQERFIASTGTSETARYEWFPAICGISKAHLERLLEKWTSLLQFEERISDEERRSDAQKRETLQPTVESDTDDDHRNLPRVRRSSARFDSPKPHRPGSIQPLLTEISTSPIPVPNSKSRPTASLSPASSYGISPRSSISSLPVPNQSGYSPVSPRSSISSLPVEASTAVVAKNRDDDIDLEIPWKICTRKSYWDYLDDKLVNSNAESQALDPTLDRNSWTEIQASWVCKEAIKEGKYEYSQFQKERQDGRRTKLEACFRIEKPLAFAEVKQLVERTVEIYRRNRPATPQPPTRRPSHPRPSLENPAQPTQDRDRDRTPLAKQYQHPPLERTSSAYVYPPPPPPLDRSNSLPGAIPTYPPNPRATMLHLPIMPAPFVPQPTQMPYLPQPSAYSPYATTFSPQAPHAPAFSPTYSPTFNPPTTDQRRSFSSFPQSPLRQSYSLQSQPPQPDHYSSTSTTSDSDTTTRSRERSHRSRSRRGSTPKKKHHSTVGTLAKVGGLAALLDSIVDLGVL